MVGVGVGVVVTTVVVVVVTRELLLDCEHGWGDFFLGVLVSGGSFTTTATGVQWGMILGGGLGERPQFDVRH